MGVAWHGRQVGGASAVQMPPANNKAVCRHQNTSGTDFTIPRLYGKWLAAGGYAPGFHLKGVVYTDSGALPDALVATSDEITVIGAGAVAMPFSTPWVWPSGAFRWLGIICDTRLDTQAIVPIISGGIKFNADTYSDGPSDPFGAVTNADLAYIIWADGYDGLKRLGRSSNDANDPTGNYFKLDAHYERFAIGGVTAPVGAATTVSVTSIVVWITSSVTVNSHCALYADDGGVSGKPHGATLLGVTNALTSVTANTWHTFTFPTPVVVPASGNYWLGFIADDVGVTTVVTQFDGQLSSAGSAQSNAAFYTWSNPVSATTPALFDQRPFGISLYAEYTLDPTPDQIVGAFPQVAEIPARGLHVVPY